MAQPTAVAIVTHADAPADPDAGTRRRVLEIVATDGPVTAAQLARDLHLTAAGVRRHLACLEQEGRIAQIARHHPGPVGRGRPARCFVVATGGQATMTHRYAELANEALAFLARQAGPEAVDKFAEERFALLERRIEPFVAAAGTDLAKRANALAEALDAEGFAASVRTVPGMPLVQVCQGHCPVQDVAAAYPQLCEAETRAFARLLGVHVQRLATLTTGGHVCTTNVPTSIRPPTHLTEGVPS
jgi:predicted ArsR family transcriptional regulator